MGFNSAFKGLIAGKSAIITVFKTQQVTVKTQKWYHGMIAVPTAIPEQCNNLLNDGWVGKMCALYIVGSQ